MLAGVGSTTLCRYATLLVDTPHSLSIRQPPRSGHTFQPIHPPQQFTLPLGGSAVRNERPGRGACDPRVRRGGRRQRPVRNERPGRGACDGAQPVAPSPPRRLVPRLRPSRREGEDVANRHSRASEQQHRASGSGPFFGRSARPRGYALAENMDLTPWNEETSSRAGVRLICRREDRSSSCDAPAKKMCLNPWGAVSGRLTSGGRGSREGEAPAEPPQRRPGGRGSREGEAPAEPPWSIVREGEAPAEPPWSIVREGEAPAEPPWSIVREGEAPAEPPLSIIRRRRPARGQLHPAGATAVSGVYLSHAARREPCPPATRVGPHDRDPTSAAAPARPNRGL